MYRTGKTIMKIWSWLMTVVMLMVLLGNFYLLLAKSVFNDPAPTVFGYSYAVVISGSMQPAIQVNDLIVTHSRAEYDVGDVITYLSNGDLVTHRIVNTENGRYTTRGDFNNAPDPNRVSHGEIVGKVVFVIPYVGLILSYLQTPLGMLVLVLFGLVLILAPGRLERRKAI